MVSRQGEVQHGRQASVGSRDLASELVVGKIQEADVGAGGKRERERAREVVSRQVNCQEGLRAAVESSRDGAWDSGKGRGGVGRERGRGYK